VEGKEWKKRQGEMKKTDEKKKNERREIN